METIAQTKVIAQALWPSATDEWHRRIMNRQFVIEVRRTVRGEHWVVATPTNPLAHTFAPRTNAIATEGEALVIAADLAVFMRDEYAGTIGGPSWTGQPATTEPICPKCEGIGTITVTLEAWGNRSECPCGYSHFYSIGD